MQTRIDRPVVLITGITGGFGKAFAGIFAEHGYTVAGISRSKPEFPVDLHIPVDLTDRSSIEKAVETTTSSLERLDVLINNAGIGHYDDWEHMSDDQLRSGMELNFFSVVTLTRLLLPLLKQSGGTIVNVASVAGKMPVPMMGAYCATKYALVAYTDTLRAELKPAGVHVLGLIVGRINTGFSSRALGNRKPPATPFSGEPDGLARKVLRAIDRRKRQLTYPGWYRFVLFLQRLIPGTFDRIAMKKWQKD